MQNLKKDYKSGVKQKPLKTRNNVGNKEQLLCHLMNLSPAIVSIGFHLTDISSILLKP